LVPARLGYVTVALVEHLIELPESLEGVPHDWVRVSTNKSKKVVRYHPPAVLERAAALERARERHAGACEAAWRRFLSVECAGRFLELRGAVRAAAGLDALCSFAALARQEGYCCPTFLDADETDETDERGDAFLDIREGRHPILDATLIGGDSVVPNSVRLGSARGFGKRLESFPSGTESFPVLTDISDSPYSAFSNEEENPRALVVTGPNMGGKSCFVRQTALLVLMAQCGSFTPARAMTLTPFEGVHTRMGAADNLAMGSSTFLEEMSECASILRAVTHEKRSLVVLDELGRGTSTHDGVAVAHATLEHLVGARAGGSRPDGSFGEENASSSSSSSRGTLTLFVTHYPSVAREVVAKRPRECAAAFTSYAEKRRTRSTMTSGPEAEDETDLRAGGRDRLPVRAHPRRRAPLVRPERRAHGRRSTRRAPERRGEGARARDGHVEEGGGARRERGEAGRRVWRRRRAGSSRRVRGNRRRRRRRRARAARRRGRRGCGRRAGARARGDERRERRREMRSWR
jgi:DNA mismatch repair protein MSH3